MIRCLTDTKISISGQNRRFRADAGTHPVRIAAKKKSARPENKEVTPHFYTLPKQ
jgi:hypothetical protein